MDRVFAISKNRHLPPIDLYLPRHIERKAVLIAIHQPFVQTLGQTFLRVQFFHIGTICIIKLTMGFVLSAPAARNFAD
ncbi:hypothetical protein PQR37_18695 [Paraburkholderia nemoris]|uniref:hypothetical protein n=1 Tax=Paraburkholderia nemoris TaxID=2793076 RepID=UPI0038BC9ACA